MIHIQYFGHSFWKVWNEEVAIVMDPYQQMGYPLPKDVHADIVMTSHDHFDHNNVGLIHGTSLVIRTEGKFDFKNVHIQTYGTFHDDEHGAKRGKNLLMQFTMEGKTFLHCGDLGTSPTPEIMKMIAKPDVLFIPVGGFYTIDAAQAHDLVRQIEPVLVFPMHYRSKLVDSKIAPVTDYLSRVDDAVQIESNVLDLTADLLKEHKTILMQF
ncbi:MAG TPA: MBL fold metallo-hydrolase [Candidatus Cloacimonadota bacterium]|nr:MBL fold metallo-hydrolase [Candidatus Cloacimonadota bacterium]HPT71267.1 MBL fold metallo-hydrolase [Candidatus Cloacimonadota bacterium]